MGWLSALFVATAVLVLVAALLLRVARGFLQSDLASAWGSASDADKEQRLTTLLGVNVAAEALAYVAMVFAALLALVSWRTSGLAAALAAVGAACLAGDRAASEVHKAPLTDQLPLPANATADQTAFQNAAAASCAGAYACAFVSDGGWRSFADALFYTGVALALGAVLWADVWMRVRGLSSGDGGYRGYSGNSGYRARQPQPLYPRRAPASDWLPATNARPW
jgi:hypothetical protein